MKPASTGAQVPLTVIFDKPEVLSAAAAAVCSVRNDNYEEHRRAAHGLNVLPRMLHLGKPLFFASYVVLRAHNQP